MAAQIGSLYVSLTADVTPFSNAMTRAQGSVQSATAGINQSVGVAERNVRGFWNSAGGGSNFRPHQLISISRAFENAADRAGLLRGVLLSTTGVFGGFLSALSSNIILRYADSYTKLQNQIRTVSDGSADTAARFTAVQAAANNSRASLEATAVLYSRLQKATPDASAGQILEYVETIQKALTLGGATAQEARSAAIQFSQAISSNRLGGEELRAILETPLGLELARGLGVTIGRLREMGTEGQLTADRVLGALTKVKSSIDQQFKQSVLTTDQALTILDNKLTDYVGHVNETYGATRLLANGILGIGNNLNTIIPILGIVAGTLAATFVGRGVSRAGGSILSAIKDDATSARERVRLLQEQVGKLNGAIFEGEMRRGPTRNAIALRQTDQFADKGTLNNLARSEQQVESLRSKTMKSLDDLSQAHQQLNGIVANVAPRAAKLAIDMANGESRIAAGLQRQVELRRQINDATNYETAALGQQALTGKLQTATDATKARIAVEKEFHNVSTAIAKDHELVAKRGMQISALTADAEQRAAERIVEQQKKVNQARATYADNRLFLGVAGLERDDARKAVSTSGNKNARQELLEQTEQVNRLREGLAPLPPLLAAAEAGATRSGIAKAFLFRQASSLVGLFGGPWGVAITVATLGLGFLAVRSAETAQKIADAQRLIEERLQKIQTAGGPGAGAAKDSLLESRVVKTKEDIRKIEDEFKRFLALVETSSPERKDATTGLSNPIAAAARNEMIELVKRFAEGNVQIDEFNSKLDQMALKNPVLREMAKTAKEHGSNLRGASQAARDFRTELDRLASGQLTAAQREGARVDPIEDLTQKSNYRAVDQSNYISPLRARAEIAAMVELTQVRGTALEIENKYQELKAKYPTLADAELRANAAQLVKLNQLTKAYNEVAQARVQEALDEGNNTIKSQVDAANYVLEAGQYVAAANLRAKGRTAEAKALEVFIQLKKQGVAVNYEEVLAIEKSKDAADKRVETYNQNSRAVETLTQRLARLREESKGAFLISDIDRDVLAQARSLKVAAADMEAYQKAAASGDFSRAPKALLDLRGEKDREAAAQSSREIVKTYGDWAQIAPLAAEKQNQLDMAVRAGAITAQQAKIAYADFLGNFGNFQWINKTADAFGTFIDSALDGTSLLRGGFENVGKAVTDLQKNLQRMVIQELISNPFRQLLRGFLSGGAGGGGMTGWFSRLFTGGTGGTPTGGTGLDLRGTGGLYDSGGVAGVVGFGPKTRLGGAISIADSGLGPRHFPAILEMGEMVLTRNLTNRTAATMAGLAANAGAPSGGPMAVHIHEAPGGDKAKVQRSADGSRMDVMLLRRIDDALGGLITSGESATNRAMESRYRVDPTRGMA